jgi:hypothetical protein
VCPAPISAQSDRRCLEGVCSGQRARCARRGYGAAAARERIRDGLAGRSTLASHHKTFCHVARRVVIYAESERCVLQCGKWNISRAIFRAASGNTVRPPQVSGTAVDWFVLAIITKTTCWHLLSNVAVPIPGIEAVNAPEELTLRPSKDSEYVPFSVSEAQVPPPICITSGMTQQFSDSGGWSGPGSYLRGGHAPGILFVP